ncbi:MAG TPA: alkaline phosphatase family protein, partial [Nocardioidaceae bacterium]|nr:alkaline phosphatase family protein [Nocardioidaceae bacterium]
MRRSVPSVLAVAALGVTTLVAAGAGTGPVSADPRAAAGADEPTKVVVILVDALSSQVVDRYDMDHVQALMQRGTNYPRSTLGHLGAETVVTHNVLTTGVLPKRMGWTDEYVRDV